MFDGVRRIWRRAGGVFGGVRRIWRRARAAFSATGCLLGTADGEKPCLTLPAAQVVDLLLFTACMVAPYVASITGSAEINEILDRNHAPRYPASGILRTGNRNQGQKKGPKKAKKGPKRAKKGKKNGAGSGHGTLPAAAPLAGGTSSAPARARARADHTRLRPSPGKGEMWGAGAPIYLDADAAHAYNYMIHTHTHTHTHTHNPGAP